MLTVVMSLVILGIITIGINQLFISQKKSQLAVEKKVNRLALHRYILTVIDCPSTIAAAPSPCPADTYVAVKSNAAGNPTIINLFSPSNPASASKIGDLSVRAKCAGGHRLVVEAKPTVSQNDPWLDITPQIPFGCVMP